MFVDPYGEHRFRVQLGPDREVHRRFIGSCLRQVHGFRESSSTNCAPHSIHQIGKQAGRTKDA